MTVASGAPSHGGFGSHIPSQDYGGVAPLPYDDPSDPTEPGLSGTTSQWAVGGNGGVGTVWMSDGKILDATLGATFCGQVRASSFRLRVADR